MTTQRSAVHRAQRALALALLPLLLLQLSPLAALADTEAATSTDATSSSSSSESSATTTAISATSSAESEHSESDTVAASSTTAASTTVDDLTIHASTTDPLLFATTTDTSEIVLGAASSTDGAGFATTTSATTTSATSSDAASSTPALDESASSTPAVSTASSTAATSSEATSTPADDVPPVASTTQTVISGAATSFANILNILNTTFLNSSGAILFANFTDPSGTIDLRNPSDLSGLCDSGCSGLHGVALNLLLDAKIANDILVSAHTGDNAIANASSSAAISTGDAMAGLNLINLANVTFANSRYLLVTLNAFRGVNGDIVFPSLYDFFSSLSGATSPEQVSLSQSATAVNNVGVGAGTGSNSIENVDGATAIETGDSSARANVYNQLNSLLVGDGLSILLRVGPDWNGRIFGLPDGVSTRRTADGLYIFGSGAGGSGGVASALTVAGTTTADIGNRVLVEALSGGNSIVNGSSTALITTGDAFAGANIINIANQTVIGRNWLLAILNIFGDFTGDISFGRPDLWVGDSANAPSVLEDGSTIGYTLTVKNRGDAIAHHVRLHETPGEHATVTSASADYATSTDGLVFDLGTMNPGEERTLTYEARLDGAGYGAAITNRTLVSAEEPDNDVADNEDGTTVTTAVPGGGGGGGTPLPNTPAASGTDAASGADDAKSGANGEQQELALVIERETPSATASSELPKVTESLTVFNDSNVIAKGLVLHDVLRDPSGAIVHSDDWNIGSLTAGDGVRIQYDFTFAPDAPSGTYTLTTQISGENVAEAAQENGTIEFTRSSADSTALSFKAATSASPVLPLPIAPRLAPVRTVAAPETQTVPDLPDTGSSSTAAFVAAAGEAVPGSGTGFMLTFLPLMAVFGAFYTIRKRYL